MQSPRFVMARSDMPRLSQETLTIIGASIVLAALILTSSTSIRGEIRDVRAEVRADREAFRSHIVRLTEQQGILSARVDGLRSPPATGR